MTFRVPSNAVLSGAFLVIVYTLVSASSDAAAKYISSDFAAPQLFALSGGLVALFSFVGAARKGNLSDLKTAHPIAVAVRSVMTLVSAVLFFYAMRELTLAEIFIFVGLMPIMAALLTPVVLNERVDGKAWIALIFGFGGVLFLFPSGIVGLSFGHALAFAACFTGVISMVMARYVGKSENKPLALLFYPHALMFAVMAIALPFVFKPMSGFEFSIAVLYSTLLFIGRFILVRALALAPTHIVMPIMNVQFVWMVGFGSIFFAETTTPNVLVGATIVIASCMFLVRQAVTVQKKAPVLPIGNHTNDWSTSRNLSRSHRSSWHSDSQSQTARRSALQ